MTYTMIDKRILICNARDYENLPENRSQWAFDMRFLPDDNPTDADKLALIKKVLEMHVIWKTTKDLIIIYCQAGHNRSVIAALCLMIINDPTFNVEVVKDKLNTYREEVYPHPSWIQFVIDFFNYPHLQCCYTCKFCLPLYGWRGNCLFKKTECYYLKECGNYVRKE